MKTVIISLLILTAGLRFSYAQMKIGVGGVSIDNSILEVKSENRGFLPPRIYLTNETMALNGGAPVDGTVVFNTNFSAGMGGICTWHHGRWNRLIDSKKGEPISFVRLAQNVFQPLNNGYTNIIWNTSSAQAPANALPMFTTGSNITIRKAGLYCVVANLAIGKYIQNADVWAERYLYISFNGVQNTASGLNAAIDTYMNVSAMIYCSENDVINIGFYNGGPDVQSIHYNPNSVTCVVAQLPMNTFE